MLPIVAGAGMKNKVLKAMSIGIPISTNIELMALLSWRMEITWPATLVRRFMA
jgi:hypothetical protein